MVNLNVKNSRPGRQRGQAAIFITLSLPVMFGLLGLVVDVGWAYWRREAAKTAASAAASAVVAKAVAISSTPATQANTACPATLDTSKPWNVGCDFAVQNGFTNGVNNRTVSIQVGSGAAGIPVSGVSPNKYWVSATVTEQIPTLFSWVVGKRSMTVLARSTVGVFTGTATGCIYTMDPSDTDISMNGNTSITTGCGIYDNSTSSSAVSIVGNNGQITTTGGSLVNVRSGGNVSLHSPSQISPSPYLLAPSVTDPFASLTGPTAGTPCITYSGQATISQGTYCNQISLNNGTLTMNPGMYILPFGMSVGGNATVKNNTTGGDGSGGVTLYISGGSVGFAGGASVTLNAPTSGLYKGMVLWQPATNTNSASLAGGATEFLAGVLYFPKAALTYNGGTGVKGTNTTIVSWTLTLVGNSYINAPSSDVPPGIFTSGTFMME